MSDESLKKKIHRALKRGYFHDPSDLVDISLFLQRRIKLKPRPRFSNIVLRHDRYYIATLRAIDSLKHSGRLPPEMRLPIGIIEDGKASSSQGLK